MIIFLNLGVKYNPASKQVGCAVLWYISHIDKAKVGQKVLKNNRQTLK